MSDEEIRVRVRIAQKKEFYTHTLIFSVVFIFCVLIWIGMGLGKFWPIWVFAAFSLTLFLEAIRVGSLPTLGQYLHFLHPDWEEQEVQKILHTKDETD